MKFRTPEEMARLIEKAELKQIEKDEEISKQAEKAAGIARQIETTIEFEDRTLTGTTLTAAQAINDMSIRKTATGLTAAQMVEDMSIRIAATRLTASQMVEDMSIRNATGVSAADLIGGLSKGDMIEDSAITTLTGAISAQQAFKDNSLSIVAPDRKGLFGPAIDSYLTRYESAVIDLSPFSDKARSLALDIANPAINALASELARQGEMIQVRFSELNDAISRPVARLQEVFAGLSASSFRQESVLADAIGFGKSYVDFSVSQLERLAEGKEHWTEVAENALLRADSMYRASTLLVEGLAGSIPVISQPSFGSYNLFPSFYESIAPAYEETDEDPEQLVSENIVVRIQETATLILERIVEINRAAERTSQRQIFKGTTKTLAAFSGMPRLIATNGNQFGEIIDHLYFLFHEGTGGKEKLSEFLTQAELEPLHIVKELRTDARHDVDHGSDSDARRKWRKFGSYYEQLGGSPYLHTPEQWRQAQLALYERLLGMVKDLMAHQLGRL